MSVAQFCTAEFPISTEMLCCSEAVASASGTPKLLICVSNPALCCLRPHCSALVR